MDADPTSRSDRPPAGRPALRASRTLAVVLSFLLPGAGQLVTGRVRAGLVFLAPALVVGLLGVVTAPGDAGRLLAVLVQPAVLLGIVVVDALVLLWRSAALIDAWWGGGRPAPRTRLSTVALVTLLSVTGVSHFAIGAQVMAAHGTMAAVFAPADDEADGLDGDGGGDGDDGFGEIVDSSPYATAVPPSPTPAPGETAAPTAMSTPTPTPAPTPTPGPLADGRLDVLLVGADAGPGRWSLRTDTLIVFSVDVASGDAALFSIPRNMVNVPLPKESRRAFDCRCYPRMINSLYVYASGHPEAFPGSDKVRGLRAVQMAIGSLVGRKLDGMVVVQLQGFVELVDAIGGISITVPKAIYDARYPLENGRGYVEIYIRAGKQHMNGRRALMYARSRHQDSDYGRMKRQQVVLEAIGTKLMKEPLLVRLPDLLEIARDNLWTNLRTGDLPDLVALAERVNLEGIANVRFIPPDYPEYLDAASIKRIRRVVDGVFGDTAPIALPSPASSPPG